MKQGHINLSITGKKGLYECKVEEVHGDLETYFLVDIHTPNVFDDGATIAPKEYQVEMHIDCNSGNLKVKKFIQDIPADLLEIELKLSDAICALNA